MANTTTQTNQEKKQMEVISKAPYDLIKIVGKHSTFWNYSKMETVEKLIDLLTQATSEAYKAGYIKGGLDAIRRN